MPIYGTLFSYNIDLKKQGPIKLYIYILAIYLSPKSFKQAYVMGLL